MLTLFGMDTEIALGGGLQIIDESKDTITSEDFIEAASFMYNVSQKADELVDESAAHVKGVVEAVKELNGDADIALVGMFNPYRSAEESEEIEADIFEVLGQLYAEAADAAAENENELNANGQQSADYVNELNDKVEMINELKAVMDKYSDSDEIQEILDMVSQYDDMTEVEELSELINASEDKQPSEEELMALLLKYDDINELQAAIEIAQNYDDLTELTELMAVMSKYRTANDEAAADAMASEVAVPMAMQMAGKNVDPQMRRLNENLKVIAEETGAVYVDVYDISPEDDFDPHPNANGHKEIADILYNTVYDIVCDKMIDPNAPQEETPAEEIPTYSYRILGDVNGDDEVDTTDAMLILSHVRGSIQLSEADLRYADINEDGEVDWYDGYVLMLFTSDEDPRYIWYNSRYNTPVYNSGSNSYYGYNM